MSLANVTIGNDETVTLLVKDADGDAVNITGWTIRLFFKENIDDTNANAKYDSGDITNLSDPTNGIHVYTIPKATTVLWTEAEWYAQWLFTISGGEETSDIFRVKVSKRLPD